MYERPVWLEKIVNLPDINTNIKSFGGHRQKVAYQWTAEPEAHFAFEIMMIIEGTQQTIFDGRTEEFSAGDILLIPPGLRHENSCQSEEGMTYFCVHFDIDDPAIQQQLLMYCPIRLQRENPYFSEIEKILSSYLALLDKTVHTLKDKLLVERLLIELVSFLLDYAEEELVKIDHSDNTTLILAKAIAETIQANFRKFTEHSTEENRELLSMDRTAEMLNISKSTMLKTFKQVYSISPKKYLDQLKYNEAKFLLHQPKLSIGEIAEVVGYQNASHFTRQFKNWSKLSPREYREMRGKE